MGFEGMEVRPYNHLGDTRTVRIDRVRVEVTQTLFGEVEYHVVGALGCCGEGWPLFRAFGAFPSAWACKQKFEAAIRAARLEAEQP